MSGEVCAPVPLDTLFLQFLERLNAPLVDSIQQMVKEHEIFIYWYSLSVSFFSCVFLSSEFFMGDRIV